MTETSARTIAGPVFRPGDQGYAEEVRGYQAVVEHRPRLVVGATCADDVRAAVRVAAAEDWSVAVQATGHGATRPADGVLVTTHRMSGVTVDASRLTARVGAGARARDLLAATLPHGLAPLHGSSPDVGVVGYTLGAGLPLLGRRYGYAADLVHSLDLVTADGELHTVSATSHPDLFWASLGGRGNVGIVTAMETGLVEVGDVLGGTMSFVDEQVEPAVRAYARWADELPDETSSSVLLARMPDLGWVPEPLRGRRVAQVRVLHPGTRADGARHVDRLRAAAPRPVIDTVAPMAYADVWGIHDEPSGPARFTGSGSLLTTLDGDSVTTLLAHTADDPGYFAEVRQLGGALARGAGGAAVSGRREGAYSLYAGTPLGDAPWEPAAARQATLHAAMEPWSTGGCLAGFLSGPAVGAAEVERAFRPEDLARLRRIKTDADPDNRFRVNVNIPPATSAR